MVLRTIEIWTDVSVRSLEEVEVRTLIFKARVTQNVPLRMTFPNNLVVIKRDSYIGRRQLFDKHLCWGVPEPSTLRPKGAKWRTTMQLLWFSL